MRREKAMYKGNNDIFNEIRKIRYEAAKYRKNNAEEVKKRRDEQKALIKKVLAKVP